MADPTSSAPKGSQAEVNERETSETTGTTVTPVTPVTPGDGDTRDARRDELASRNLDDLRLLASELDVPGRSGLNKEQLIDAIVDTENRDAANLRNVDRRGRAERESDPASQTALAEAGVSGTTGTSGTTGEWHTDTPNSDEDESGLKVYRAEHEGHDVRATSTVVAKDEQEARDLIREVQRHEGLAHPNTPIVITRVNRGLVPRNVELSEAGVVMFDDGRR